MSSNSHVLVLNCGSSSFKFALIDSATGHQILHGLAEKLGDDDASITIKRENEKNRLELGKNNQHVDAIKVLVSTLQELGLDTNIGAIGHRVVHGGEMFTKSAVIDDDVITAIEAVSALAPLHNPANLIGIKAAQVAFPGIPQVAVFDTAFHQTMPEKAYMYAIDKDHYKEKGIRRYGFHGTSHFFVAQKAAEWLNKSFETTSVITVHLGNGCSVCAISDGKSVDTSMGMTPLEGLMMGTRSGDIDPGVIMYLMKRYKYDANQIDDFLNKQSGMLGLSQLSNDCRTLEDALNDADNEKRLAAQLTLEVYSYRVAKYIAGYTCALTQLDAVVFTGGIGENSNYIRDIVVKHLGLLGLTIDDCKNQQARFGQAGAINDPTSRTPVLVIPTNEEWVIAQDAAKLTKGVK